MKLLAAMVALAIALPAFAETTLEVIHKKTLAPDGHGSVRIAADAIEFEAKKSKNSRRWTYQDIQHFDRLSATEFVLLTYQDVGWQLGRDKQYRFQITSGELTDELLQGISEKIGRPVTNRLFEAPADARYEVPVKHLHGLGGCEGKLIFTDEVVYYTTENHKDAREWRLDRDIDSVWSSNPYHLELHVYDNNRREFSRTRVYKFDLKKRLDSEFYRRLKLQLFERETAHHP